MIPCIYKHLGRYMYLDMYNFLYMSPGATTIDFVKDLHYGEG